MVDKNVYNSTLSLVFSPCKHFIVAGNIYGDIGVFLMKDIFAPKGECLSPEKKPKRVFSTPNNEKVNSLTASKQFLIAGTVGVIYAWEWASLPKKDLKVSWNISIPSQRDSYLKPDVNSLVLSDDSDSPFLFAGCGDNMIYMYSLEDGREIRAFESHSDYIHSLSYFCGGLVSSSEDGSVKEWDSRLARVTSTLVPWSKDHLARPDLGKWIADVSIHNNYLVCGGGPKGSMWDLRKQSVTSVFECGDKGVHVCKMFDENVVVVGGAVGFVSLFDAKGELDNKLPSSSPLVYTTAQPFDSKLGRSLNEVMAFGGASNSIDVCCFKIRSHILTFL